MNDDKDDAPVATDGSKSVNNVAADLQNAISGLLFTSESDYPITIFQLQIMSSMPHIITADDAKSLFLSSTYMPSNINTTHRKDWTGNIVAEETSLDWFFRRYTQVQDWWEQSQLAILPRWKHLELLINQAMLDVLVFRMGQASSDCGLYGSIDVFIVGRCQDDSSAWLGLHTISVET